MMDGQPKQEYHPPLSEWTSTVELQAMTVDLLQQVISVLVAANGGKPRQITPTPRPENKYQAHREDKQLAAHRKLVSRMLPHKRGPSAR